MMWSHEFDAILTDGLATGKTFSQIALVLHKTRNSCIGRAHRLHQVAIPRVTFWTDERTAMLSQWRKEGVRLFEIAKRFQCSHSAVSGKVKRLLREAQLAAIPKPVVVPAVRQKRLTGANGYMDEALNRKIKRAACSGPPRLPPLRPINERFAEGYHGQIGRVSLMELTANTCRFPITPKAGPPIRYCGDTVAGHSVYCSHHAERTTKYIQVAPAIAAVRAALGAGE